jgi:hypothetical protein
MAIEHCRHPMNQNHYRHLFVMTAFSFMSMYVLMYAMVNTLANVYSKLNQVYMDIRRGGLGGLRLQRPMHALVSAVLLVGTPATLEP